MMSEDDAPSDPAPRWPRLLLAGVVVLLILAAVFIYFNLPNRTGPSRGEPVASVSSSEHGSAVVNLRVTIESINATSGFASLRLSAIPLEIPKEGIVILSSLGTSPAIVVRPDQLVADSTAQVPFTSGSVAEYPFEQYTMAIGFLVVAGTDTSLTNIEHRTALPFLVTGVDDAAGIDATATHQVHDQQVEVDFVLTRATSTKGWVLAMMAIYWLLSLGALTVALSIIGRFRPWETRQLAWLSALLFALISFRSAAPGNPPIGTFFDFFAVFEAVGIVAISLLSLTVVYLVRSRKHLGL